MSDGRLSVTLTLTGDTNSDSDVNRAGRDVLLYPRPAQNLDAVN